VRCRSGSDVRGPFLCLDTDGGPSLRLRLYRQAATTPRAVERLVTLSFSRNRGWVAQLDGPGGRQRVAAWTVDVRGAVTFR
jgi:hypothetical protein